MKSFSLLLQDAIHMKSFDRLVSFVGEDASGSFGILAGHARMMTVLVMGLARFRLVDDSWYYLAQPGALLYFNDNRLVVSSRHYIVDQDYNRISRQLQQQLLAEELALDSMKQSLQNMEDEILKRLWEMRRSESAPI
jgi:F-type H+-transporting ATPase subunit epsilon